MAFGVVGEDGFALFGVRQGETGEDLEPGGVWTLIHSLPETLAVSKLFFGDNGSTFIFDVVVIVDVV